MSDQPNRALFDAIDRNDFLEVQKALRDGADANAQDEDGDTALFKATERATKNGDLVKMKLLLENRADTNARDEDGDTALFKATESATENGDLKIMKLLLENRADPNIESGYSGAPIHHAAYWNASTDLVQLLLDKGANVNLQRHSDSSTPLTRAAESGNLELTQLLLEHGADPNLQDDSYGAPLHIAAYNGRCEEIIDLLLANEANIHLKRSNDGVTPLYEAVRGKELEIAKKLFKKDSDLNIINSEKETFLHHAVNYYTMDFLNLLEWSEECPIDVNSLTSYNDTPLIFAARAGSIGCVKWLLQQGADVNTMNKSRRTAVLMCARAGNVELAELLVNRSQKVIYAIDIEGRGAFHHAASWGHSDFIEWFHNIRGASDVDPGEGEALDPNRTDIYGMTFIHRALDFYEPSIVKSCLKFCRSSIVDEVDHMGNTPLHTALINSSAEVEIQSILIKNMSLSARCRRNNNGDSILSLAAESAIENAKPASKDLNEDPCKKFLLSLIDLPLDVEKNKSAAWPTIIRCDPTHVTEIEKNLKVLFLDPILPETIIFWAARNGAKDLLNKGLAGLTDSALKKKIIPETLYWASASEQSEIVTIITESYQDEVRFDAKTIEAIRVAAFAGYESIVCSLLRCIRTDQQRPQSPASKGLFWAVTWRNEHAREVVRRLLMNGASVNSVADGGMTILQWAEEYNKTTGPGREEKEYDMLGLLESPIRVPLRPKAPQRPKAKDDLGSILDEHMCTISDFYCHNNAFYTLQRRGKCREVIYAEGVAKRMKESWNEWFPNSESRMPDFRWVHLPLNDWKLAKDLMNAIYSETPTADLEYARCETFVEGSQKEHTGSPQSSFMYPAFHFQTRDHGSGESSTLIQFLDHIAKTKEKRSKSDPEKNGLEGDERDSKPGKAAKESTKTSNQKKNPTSRPEGEPNKTSRTEQETDSAHGERAEMKETNDTVSLNQTEKMKEHAEQHSEPVLTDDHIEKSNDLHTDVPEGPEKSELIIKAPEQNAENTDSSSLATRRIEPTLIVSSSDGTSYVPTNQAELDTHQGEAAQRAHKHVAETILQVNRSSINTLKADPIEQSSKNLPLPSDTQVDDAASVSGDNHSILSQKSTADELKEFEKHTPIPPGVISSSGPGAGPDSGNPPGTSKGKRRLEKCKVALYMPFLTFQTVKEQRKRRQDIAFSEFAGRSHAPKNSAASQTDPKNHAEETYKHLAREAASMLRSKPSESTKLSQEMIHKAIRCVTRHRQASGQNNPDAEGAAKLLESHVNSMDKDVVDEETSSGAPKSTIGSSVWKGKSFESPRKKESTTDMNQAIEYLIDALSLSNSSKYSSNSAAQSEDSTKRADGSVGGDESGQKRKRHESRTLDQYFYSSLPDTVRRDADQVIVRYQAKKRCLDGEEHASEKSSSAGENPSLPAPSSTNNPMDSIPQGSNKETEKPQADDVNKIYLRYQEKFKLCMVDQLWLWVLDDKTIITCFPHTETYGDQEKELQRSPLDLICDHINRDMRPQIRNVYDLAALITSFCASSIDECQARIGNGKETLLDMFSESIGLVADREVMLFNSFKNRLGVLDVSDLDLKDDIELLEEIKDIRDELNILERILDDQDDLTQKLFNLFDIDEHESTSTRHLQDQVLQYYQQRAGVGLRLDRIKKMDEDAKISYDAINYLLDLKQKHANVMEAKAARKQAQETADQGRTILVFTIVTIVFAPLSFLCSFFALNIESFPHTDGNISFPSSWIYWRIYGISVAIFMPLVVGTLAYGPVKSKWEQWRSDSDNRTHTFSEKNAKAKPMKSMGEEEGVDSHCHDRLARMIQNRKSCRMRAQNSDVESGKR